MQASSEIANNYVMLPSYLSHSMIQVLYGPDMIGG